MVSPPSMRWQLRITTATFGVWVLVYFVAFGGSAWHPTDYEHIPAMSYRVGAGEVPYRDFVYHKPPGSLLLHVVWLLLPDRIEVRASRLFVYVQMAAATLLPLLWLLRRGVVRFGWRLLALAVATTSIALHNFPVMPWYTIDGLFFSVLGWVALLESTVAPRRRALAARATASAALTFAALCKQGFALPIAAFAAYVASEAIVRMRARSRGHGTAREVAELLTASVLPGVVVLGGVAGWLYARAAWSDFVAQLVSHSTGGVLSDSLLGPYWNFAEDRFDERYLWVMGFWALVPTLRLVDGKGLWAYAARALALVPLGLLAHDATRLAGGFPSRLGSVLGAMLAGLLLGQTLVGVGLWLLGRRGQARDVIDARWMLLQLGVMIAAVSCQVSYGYASPILAMGALGIILHHVLPDERSLWLDMVPAVLAAFFVVSAMWQINVLAPYRDGPRAALTADLGALFPRLSGIRTTPANFERYQALADIVKESIIPTGRSFAVLQDYPGINWLLGTRNPIGIDWNWYGDIEGYDERLIRELDQSGAVAIVPKEISAGSNRPSFAVPTPCRQLTFAEYTRSALHVVRQWPLLAENAFFCLYVKETVPR